MGDIIEKAAFHTGFFGGGEKLVGHCHSVMHKFAAHAHTETIQIFKFSGGGETEAGGGGYSRAPPSV